MNPIPNPAPEEEKNSIKITYGQIKVKKYRKEEKIMKNFKYAVMFLSAVFCCGIMGSLELGRISLPDACGYVFAAAAACIGTAIAEIIVKILKINAIRLIRKLKFQSQNSALKYSGRHLQTHGYTVRANAKYH